jgi:hypothetical protein
VHRCSSQARQTSGTPQDTEAWNGSSWQAARLAIPSGARFVALMGVSCGGPRGYVAIGGFLATAAVTSTLAEAWNGSAAGASR